MAASILIVDDEPNIRRMLGSLLRHEGYSTTEAANGAEARARLNDTEVDVTLLDLAIPDVTGFELLETIHQRWPLTPVIMMSGRASLSDAVQATKLGAFHFIEKPLTPEAVLLTIRGALDLRKARMLSRDIAREYGPGDELVGASGAMEAIRELVGRVAPTDARVLITGESGTGKELVAAALHARSPRAHASFVRLNSAAIPRELIESELFGHERGAFSGAHARHRGKFELADGGTLLLDEVGDLSADAQAKLLRVIETGEVERVGAERALKVDVRIVTATNKNLTQAINDGRFREDLFHRLNVIPIEVPPLRSRREDIPALVRHFMEKWQARTGRPAPGVSGEAMASLQRYDWPGNVRELANLCERMAIMCDSKTVDAASVSRALPATAAGQDVPLHDQLDKHERDLIESAITRAHGNIADAAKLLKTDRANLYRRMRRLGIER